MCQAPVKTTYPTITLSGRLFFQILTIISNLQMTKLRLKVSVNLPKSYRY